MVLLEDDQPSRIGEGDLHISRVYQRVRVRTDRPDHEEIWALLEMEVIANTDLMENSTRRFREWKRFNTESELQDFIRRDVGEPVTLPPYSFSPEQSAAIQQEAAGEVAKITEEFRRFRVRAELTRKQLDSQIRDLQSANVLNAAKRIEANGSDHYREHRSDEELERTRAALAAQETRWKEAYDLLLAENKALKSTGSEALLASQWRQRYETCLKEKEDLESRLNQDDQNKYEEKYRDLKESFRLYRKKAKEIFEQQQHNGAVSTSSISNLASTSSADAKLSYLKNLMLNYLTADPAVRDHMQVAIGTVLQFTTDELDKIEKRSREGNHGSRPTGIKSADKDQVKVHAHSQDVLGVYSSLLIWLPLTSIIIITSIPQLNARILVVHFPIG